MRLTRSHEGECLPLSGSHHQGAQSRWSNDQNLWMVLGEAA